MSKKGPANRANKAIIEFFNDDYRWWETIYENNNDRKFLSYEMQERKKIILENIEKYVQQDGNERVLDCGCGPGEILRSLRQKGINVVGVDINENFIKSVDAEFNEKVAAIRGDVEHLPFQDESFDVVFCAGVLSYLKEDDRALSEILRVLKKQGIAIITFPNLFPLYKFVDPYYFFWGGFKYIARQLMAFVDKRKKTIKFNQHMIRKYSFWTVCEKLKSFEKLECRSVSFGPFTLLNRPVIPFNKSKRLSMALTQICQFKCFKFFNILSSRWVFTVQKF